MTGTLPRATCPGCGVVVACELPARGNGESLVFRRHNRPTGGRCPYSRAAVKVRELVSLGTAYAGRAK